jgi:hypothetical protein
VGGDGEASQRHGLVGPHDHITTTAYIGLVPFTVDSLQSLDLIVREGM